MNTRVSSRTRLNLVGCVLEFERRTARKHMLWRILWGTDPSNTLIQHGLGDLGLVFVVIMA